ncbi:hypothetical protein PENTCL1PPCAC_15532, partial [Pristionchus entomophagus]
MVEEVIPSDAFNKVMIRMIYEVYEMSDNSISVGGTMRYSELNYDRTLTYFALFYAVIPYLLTYAALGILIYQVILIYFPIITAHPVRLKILKYIFSFFVYGVFTQSDLGMSALWFTSFLWICPSVQ